VHKPHDLSIELGASVLYDLSRCHKSLFDLCDKLVSTDELAHLRRNDYRQNLPHQGERWCELVHIGAVIRPDQIIMNRD
jgi:hypothetical protein